MRIGGGPLERIGLFDAMKGACMILVVAGHSGAPFTRFVYLFHMAAFLIVSGIFHRGPDSFTTAELVVFFRRKARSLWVPYALWMSVFTLLHNVFVRACVYSDDPVFLATVQGSKAISYIGVSETLRWVGDALVFRGHEQIGGAFWFFAVLFQVSILYGLFGCFVRTIGFGRREPWFQTAFACALLVGGYLASVHRFRFLGLEMTCSVYCLYHIGAMLSPYRARMAALGLPAFLVLICISFPCLLLLSRFGRISLVSNQYGHPVFLLFSSVSGFLLLYGISGAFSRVAWANRFLELVGRNTRAVLIFHFLAFKVVSAVGVAIFSRPACLIAAFPVLFHGGHWWVAYTAVGVLLPIVLGVLNQGLSNLLRCKWGGTNSK